MSGREHARRFHFLREIASGGFGTVHLVKVMHADGFSRLVAVKLLKTQWSDTDEVARRMRDEARLLGLLRHRNIVDVIDLTSIDGRAAVVMEYLEGIDLRQLGQVLSQEDRQVPLRAALEIAAAAASALDAAYNRPPMPGEKPLRVIHRDIKPSNIMVDDSGGVKVLDFGVARSEIENRESHTQELQFGSVDYMAPERLFFEPETPASDVYSLGATLFELLTGSKLGKARGRPQKHAAHLTEQLQALRSQRVLEASIAAELDALLLATLAFDHEERPTAAEFYQRARVLSRLAGDDDLSGWAEQVLPPIIPMVTESRRKPNPLDDTVLLEDSKAFAAGSESDEPVRPSADELRRGALAELDESVDQVLAAPPTGAPSGGSAYTPDDEDAWDDGPTHIGGIRESPELAAALGRLDHEPLNTEEAVRRTARGAAASDLPPDPADPFAALTELSNSAATPVARVPLRDAPVPLPSAPTPSPRGRRPMAPPAPQVPDLDLDLDEDPGSVHEVAPTVPFGDHTEAPTEVMLTDGKGGGVKPVGPGLFAPAQPGTGPEVATETVTAEGDLAESEASQTLNTPMGMPIPAPHPDAAASQSVTAVAPDETRPSAGTTVVEPVFEEPEPQAEPPLPAPANERGGPSLALVAVGGGAVGLLLLLLVLGVGYTQREALLALAGGAAEPAQAARAEPAPEPPAAAQPAPAPSGPALVFESALSDMRKLNVQCDIGSAKGTTQAAVPGEAAESCTVTAILQDRTRHTAVVQAPKAGTYRCFANDSSACEAQ